MFISIFILGRPFLCLCYYPNFYALFYSKAFALRLDLLKRAGLPYALLSIVHFTMTQMSLPGIEPWLSISCRSLLARPNFKN